MNRTTSLYETCENLFDQYPLAVHTQNFRTWTYREMVLMLDDGGEPAFFILGHGTKDGTCYDLHAWMAGPIAEIGSASELPATGEVADILTSAIPLPREGAFLAWQSGGVVTTLISVHTQSTPEIPQPTWTMLALEDAPESSWPPFAGERLFGSWFWDYYRNGSIVDLAPLTAATPGTIFWAEPDSLTWACCAVARDVTSPDGWTLPQGRYVYTGSLRDGETAGPLDDLLAGDVTDLSPRFRTAA